MPDVFAIASNALPSATRVLGLRGTEGLSALYGFEVHLLVEDPAFDPAAALGAGATLSIRAGERPLAFHGVLSTLEIVNDLARGAVVRAVLVPRLWRLTLTRHSRVFVNQSLPAILDAVLQGAGVAQEDYALKLTGTYGPLEHVCQYRESSFAFLSRRMEREGVYYFFEQGEDRERLIITDDRAVHDRLFSSSVRYYQVSGAGASGIEGLHAFRGTHSSVPGSVRVRDYDYLRPGLDVTGSAPVSGGGEEVHLHGENVITPEEGARIARVRAEELKARKLVFRGAGRGCFLRAGYTFALEDHPRPGVDGAYLVTELEHRGGGQAEGGELLGGDADEGYRVDVVAIPASVQFRPDQRTPMPRIYGMEGAVIDGDADTDYAQLDEHGRYLVKMRFDETAARDGKASARVRMMQPHGGSPENFHFPLRKGTEVLLAFEGGDPDRPVIAGVVPNAVTPSLVSSRNATKNILQTGGGNRLIIEDEKGKEYIHLSSPHQRSFLHMGSTFNPQYNVIKNTDGTSLTYTTLLATSFTGDDSQTIVDRARVTVIGRSQMTTSDPAGQEVATLLGEAFVTSLDDEIVPDDADANSLLLGTANSQQQTALTAAQTAVTDWTALIIPPAPIPASWNQTALTDSNATNLGTPVTASVTSANTWANDTSTQRTIDVVAVASKAAAMTTQLANLNKAITALQAATTPTAALLATVVSTAQALLYAVDALSSVLKYDTAHLPDSPHSNVLPTYINIQRASPDTLMPTLTLEQVDWVGVDVYGLNILNPAAIDPSMAPPLHAGADVKIVGGDNVNLVAHDARQQIEEHAYSLIKGGQTSVIYSPQATWNPLPIVPPTLGYVPTTLGTPTLTGLRTAVAQASTIYGDTYAWVNGGKTSTVTSGAHTAVYAPARGPEAPGRLPTQAPTPGQPPPVPIPVPATDRSVAQAAEVYGNQFSWVDGTVTSTVNKGSHSEIFAPSPASNTGHHVHTEATTAQSAVLHGDQFSWIDGNKTTNVTGSVDSTVSGGQTTHVFGGQTTHISGGQMSLVDYKTTVAALATSVAGISLSLSLLKLNLSGLVVSMGVAKIDGTVLALHNHPISMKTGVNDLQNHVLTIFS